MPATRQRGSSSRASTRSATNGTTRGRTSSSGQSSASKSSGQSSASKSSGQSSASKSTAKRSKSTRASSNGARGGSRNAGAANRASEATSSASRTAKSSSSNGNHEAVRTVGASIAGATVGVLGGVLLGRNALQRHRKLPPKIDLTGVGQQIGEAGRQFARLASEVRSVKEKAEQIGRILS